MKKNYLFVLSLTLIWPMLISSNTGVANEQNKDRTGAPGSDTPCNNGGCHTAGAFNPTTLISILEMGQMTPVAQYIPGETYLMRVTITAGTGTPSTHGFQGTAVFDVDGGPNAGNFQNPGAFVALESVGSRHIVEHNQDNPANFFEVEWVAPSAGQGSVTFYVSAVASNNSGSDSGDGYDGHQLTLTEDMGSSIDLLESVKEPFLLSVAGGSMQVSFSEDGRFMVYELSGKLITDVQVKSGEIHTLENCGKTAILRLTTATDTFAKKIVLP